MDEAQIDCFSVLRNIEVRTHDCSILRQETASKTEEYLKKVSAAQFLWKETLLRQSSSQFCSETFKKREIFLFCTHYDNNDDDDDNNNNDDDDNDNSGGKTIVAEKNTAELRPKRRFSANLGQIQ